MKKTILIVALFLAIFCLTACDPESHYYNYEELKNTVTGIELINYSNADAKELFEKRDKVISFDFDKMEILETLKEEHIDNFLQEFSKIDFMLVWRHLDSPKGKSVRLIYENGDFEVISCNVQYSGSFNSEGNVKKFIGSGGGSQLISLIDKYFTTQI